MKKFKIAYYNYAEAKRALQVQSEVFGQNNRVRSKQWYTMMFSHLKGAKQFKELFSLSESLSMKWDHRLRGLTMFVFSFGVESLELSVKLGRLVIFDFLTIPFSEQYFFQTDNQRLMLFTVSSLLELFLRCCIFMAKENLIEMPAIVLLANFQRIQMLRQLRLALDWLSVSFFVYWPIRMSGLLYFFALN